MRSASFLRQPLPAPVPLIDYQAARERARNARKGDTIYPILTVFGDTWFRQLTADSPLEAISTNHARLMLGLEAVK